MLIINRVSHYFDKQRVLDDVSFDCAGGAITCLIGPSGCGKTTLLRLTAGLLELRGGEISLDDEVLASPGLALPPEQRPVGMVFQEGALFPHMTVADNVGFGLQDGANDARVGTLLEQVGLSAFAHRYPDSLSGGQRQRVALARALAPSPRALLFDEPFANLDVQLRRTLRDDARRMVQETGTIGLFVTHDPDEVMAIADQVVVLDRGRVEQAGEPQTLYDAPASFYVAQLFGDAQTLDAVLETNRLETPFGAWDRSCLTDSSIADGNTRIVVHPQALRLEPSQDGAQVVEIRAAGACNRVTLRAEKSDTLLIAELPRAQAVPFTAGDRVQVTPTTGSVFAAASP